MLSSPTSLPSLRSLAGKTVSSIAVLAPEDAAPTGCAVYTVGSAATVFLDVKGRIEVDGEIKKAKERLRKANETVERQKKIMGAEGWEGKASDVVKEGEREKLRAAEIEGANWEMTLEQFERLKLEG